ncbi:SCO family protein [Pseudoduganella sp. GCM10020061]|uniref:SCO family protein n=1 Tax=Pseudoduganella sp. GCM10020061 TaxID=3317345 RepID=UPI003644362D
MMLRHFAPFLFALAVGTAAAADTSRMKAGVFDPPRAAPPISMRAVDGTQFSLDRHRGKVVVLVFGYTACGDVCPVTAGMLAQARRKLGDRADKLQVVFVSVDPERDTPQALREYLANFDKSFIGITGTEQQMAAIRNAYGIQAKSHPLGAGKNDYVISHSTFLYLIDPQGKLRALMPFGHSPADIVHDFEILMGR